MLPAAWASALWPLGSSQTLLTSSLTKYASNLAKMSAVSVVSYIYCLIPCCISAVLLSKAEFYITELWTSQEGKCAIDHALAF